MKYFVLLTVLAFASKNENNVESVTANLGEKVMENAVENPIVVKIEEDECAKKKGSNYIGVPYDENRGKWRAVRWSKTEKKQFHNGYYKDEETATHASDTLARKLMANGDGDHKLNFPDDNTEVHSEKKIKRSKYVGVFFNENRKRWLAQRWSKTEKKLFRNGDHKDEETAAYASDNLARELMANGEGDHKLNFPEKQNEVLPEEKTRDSKYIGVSYHENSNRWIAQRWSKLTKKLFSNGSYKNEETAAHASDTLARKLMENGKQNLKLNFPDDTTEVHKKTKHSKYFGVSYNKILKRWVVQRWSKTEKKLLNNKTYKDEETAAHASDTLARKLMVNGEKNLKLNFSDDKTGVHPEHPTNKRKRSFDLEHSQSDKENLENFEEKEK